VLASKLTPRILVENGKKERASYLLVCVLRLRESRVSSSSLARYVVHFTSLHKRTSNTIIIIISNQFISLSSHEFVLL